MKFTNVKACWKLPALVHKRLGRAPQNADNFRRDAPFLTISREVIRAAARG
jgi:hypothetical protein